MKIENDMPKWAKMTRDQDIDLNKDLFSVFLEGDSHPEDAAIEMLQCLFDKHRILDENGEVLSASLEMLREFGVIGIQSDYIDYDSKVIPIFVVQKFIFLMKSPDWL